MLLKLRFLQPMDWKSPLVFPLCHSRSIRSRSTLLLVALKWCFYAAHAANIQSWYMEITFSVGERFYQLQNMLVHVITGKINGFLNVWGRARARGTFWLENVLFLPGDVLVSPKNVVLTGNQFGPLYCVHVLCTCTVCTLYICSVFTPRALKGIKRSDNAVFVICYG